MVATGHERREDVASEVQASRPPKALRRLLLLAAGAAIAWGISSSFYVIDVTQYGVVTRFGRVLQVVEQPGLHVTAPLDLITRLDRRTLFSRTGRSEYLTADKKNIVVESLVVWRIADPVRFLTAIGSRGTAEARLSEAISSEIGSQLGRESEAAMTSPNAGGNRYAALMATIQERVDATTRPAYGIALVRLGLDRLSLPEQNREHVFDRMKAERARIAKENRSSGELEAKRITARAEHEKVDIESDAAAEVVHIRAEADAGAARAYADAFSRNPGFYRLVRTFDAYEKFLDDRTTLFLSPDAEVLRLLDFTKAPAVPEHEGNPEREGAESSRGADAAAGVSPAPGGTR